VRRKLLSQLLGCRFSHGGAAKSQEPPKTSKTLKVVMKSAWGSDDPTRASFPFLHGLSPADAGHEVQIFLTGEATYLMRKVTANAVMPVGWPPLSETLHSDLFLRGVLPRPWVYGNRFESVGSKIRESDNLRIACGMGGSDHHRVGVTQPPKTGPTRM